MQNVLNKNHKSYPLAKKKNHKSYNAFGRGQNVATLYTYNAFGRQLACLSSIKGHSHKYF